MRFSIVAVLAACWWLAGCSKEAAPPPPKPKAEKPPHCFFKDEEAKDWKIATKGDQLVVTGRAYRSDPRYKTIFLEPKVEGGVAVLRPSIAVNDTGFATSDDWWDMEAILPSGAIETVEIRCGKKLLATLQVEAPAG